MPTVPTPQHQGASKTQPKDTWNFNADRIGQWRWSLSSPSREVLRSSAEAYKTRAEAVKNAKQYGYTGA